MAIRSAQFVKAVTGTEGLPEVDFPVVAFLGRSNVGKSSVINSLVRVKKLAYSSNTQGRTTAINYFLIDKAVYFVDLPGYGFAKLSHERQEKIGKQLSWFVNESMVPFRYFVLIVDAEIGLKNSDHATYALLADTGHKIVLVANKADKGKQNDVARNVLTLRTMFPEAAVVRYSAKTGEGRNELLALLLEAENEGAE
ncbi:MAG: ribosome biogenesis GTP-binding protein YsxC [Candidatus Moranbacteria bacterium]|jgi:GTP-binding protein|nr:ribosome biogenesis GTP-binding protein YsxC [Candidatus Moranbacteria bacterium]MBP9801458.1 ribosome biogenesis GTP-binding protein YsxC [Candidatus Moranbacteria bacterium]